ISSTPLQLAGEKIDHLLEWIEAECRGDGRTEIRVGVDVVEHPSAIVSLQILDPTDIEPGRLHDPFCGFDRVSRHGWVRVELHRRGADGIRHLARTFTLLRVADGGRTRIEATVRLDAHAVQKLAPEELETDDALFRIMRKKFLEQEEVVR